MKNLLYSFLIFTFIACTARVKPKCDSVRTGKFIFNPGFSNRTYLIDRNDSFQIEKRKEDGRRWRFKIHWPENCHYHLTYLDQDKGDTEKVDFKEVDCKILEISDWYYVFSMSVPNMKNGIIDTMWKQ